MLEKVPSVGEVWIFSGTTHCEIIVAIFVVKFQLVSILDSIIVGYGFVASVNDAGRHTVARRPLMCCPFQTH